MPETAVAESVVANGKGGRPRIYPSIQQFDALVKRLDAMGVPAVAETAVAVATDSDKNFIEQAIIAYVSAEGAAVVGDVSLPGTIAVVSALLAVRDHVVANAASLKTSMAAHLREVGAIS